MRKFLRALLFISLPIIIVAYPLDMLISYNLKKSNTYAGKEFSVWNDILAGKVNSDIIIDGSSRAWVHIDPTMLGDSLHAKAYNFGMDGHNFWLSYLRHKLFLKYNPKPKLIIFSLDIFTLQKREDLYNGDQFLPYMLWNNEIEESIESYKGFGFYDFKIPLLRYTGKYQAVKEAFKMLVQEKDKNITRVRGYEGQVAEWNSDFENAKNKLDKIVVKFDTASIQLFDKFINECQTDKIGLVFVYSPEYIEGQDFVKNRKKVFEKFNYFSQKYNIPFYDFSNDSISFDKKYFYNASHLNKNGAELFTKKLVDSLKVGGVYK